MAMNPMQRRSRNMFLLGFLLAAVIGAGAVLFINNKVKELQVQVESLKNLQKSYLVAAADLESGAVLDLNEDFTTETVQTTVPQDEVISDEDFIEKDSNGNLVVNENGESIGKDVMLKISVPKGTIVTKDMIVDTDDPITNTDRIQEYNMIMLPSRLVNGSYVDIRFGLTNGQDYIVLSKKRVLGCTDTSIWLKLNETEYQLLNSAIVDAYMITGAKLYALPYIEAGTQKAATQTYTANQAVVNLLTSFANEGINLVDEIGKDNSKQYLEGKTALDAWNIYNKTYSTDLRGNFEDAINAAGTDETAVAQGFTTEKQTIQKARQDYIKELEGTEDVGYTNE